jgi:hypothetical protein
MEISNARPGAETSANRDSHELVEIDVFGSLPPLLPLVGVVGGERNITYRSIEPDVYSAAQTYSLISFRLSPASPLPDRGSERTHT